MKTNPIFLSGLLSLMLLASACGSPGTSQNLDGSDDTGGGTGGRGTGGIVVGTGGASGTGGAIGTGGDAGTGGVVALRVAAFVLIGFWLWRRPSRAPARAAVRAIR